MQVVSLGYSYVSNSFSISQCLNGGLISASGTSNDVYTGGIVGYGGGEISECSNTVKIEGLGKAYVGGIAGGWQGYVSDSYNTGDPRCSDGYGGGLCGNLSGVIQNCYSYSHTGGIYNVWGYLLGEFVSGWISNCYYVDFGGCGSVASGSSSGATALETTGVTRKEITDRLNADRTEKIWSNDQGFCIENYIDTPGLSWKDLANRKTYLNFWGGEQFSW